MDSFSQGSELVVGNVLPEELVRSGLDIPIGLRGPLNPDVASGQPSLSVPLHSHLDPHHRWIRPKRTTRPPLRFSPPSVTQPKHKRARLLRLDSAGQAIGDTDDFVRQLFGEACTNTQDDLLGLAHDDLEVHLQSSSTCSHQQQPQEETHPATNTEESVDISMESLYPRDAALSS